MGKHYLHWEPITNPILQNMIMGGLTGLMTSIALRLNFLRVSEINITWIIFLLIGIVIGYMSGVERIRYEKRIIQEKEGLQADLDKIRKVLKRAEDRFRIFVDQINEAIYLTTYEGKFIYFNQATTLLSGYPKEKLKKLILSDLQVDEDLNSNQLMERLKKNIYRYEERWKTVDGHVVHLEINAKTIEVAGQQLILFVARDIVGRKKEHEKRLLNELSLLHKTTLHETANIQYMSLKKITSTLTDALNLIKTLVEQDPKKIEKFSNSLNEWKNTLKLLKELSLKHARDLENSLSNWDINQIIVQELRYMEMLWNYNVVVETWFAPNLPMVSGYGRDFSLAFGTIFKALVDTMTSQKVKNLSISTKHMVDSIVIEIEAAKMKEFDNHLAKVVNPVFHNKKVVDSRLEKAICRMFFNSFGAKLEFEHQEVEDLHIKIWIPIQEGPEK